MSCSDADAGLAALHQSTRERLVYSLMSGATQIQNLSKKGPDTLCRIVAHARADPFADAGFDEEAEATKAAADFGAKREEDVVHIRCVRVLRGLR